MSLESENFDQLRRLLALKRHEQPPPGYFHRFSREVIVRIKAGETGNLTRAPWWNWNGSWMQRVWASIENRPAFAGAFGVAVCGFFTAGALLSDKTETTFSTAPESIRTADNQEAPIAEMAAWSQGSVNLGLAKAPTSTSLFEEIQRFQTQQGNQLFRNVNFVPGN
jgi:hypothetical protein